MKALTKKWPGRPAVKRAVLRLRMAGKLTDYCRAYGEASKRGQKAHYPRFRAAYYWLMHGVDFDGKRIGK